MFFLPDPYLSDKKTEKLRFCLAPFGFQKNPSALKTAGISKSGFKATNLATLLHPARFQGA